ncbi:hypothetical protein BASA81_004862 [Batrachochytrium salamandrivorans]|nr:hypothetical protein BASA81_004862 [Batrachochytrium salamandrivorans]
MASHTSSSNSPGKSTMSFSAEQMVGSGSFGVVFKARVAETGETVAIKKVLQDKRFKNRELQIMKMIFHTNIVQLKSCFYAHSPAVPGSSSSSGGVGEEDLYLNLVMEFIPETVYSMTKHFAEQPGGIPNLVANLYMYQLCRALAHIHGMGVCHRDIKPQNLLVDPVSSVLKLCDFGSAKQLVQNEPNVSYICSRYYRAPELIFGACDYTCQIDTWSAGCVAAELILGKPLFPGKDCVEQLVMVFRVLGTPSREEVFAMNPNYTNFRFTTVESVQWKETFPSQMAVHGEFVDLISRMLVYNPVVRASPIQALLHHSFDRLRQRTTMLPNGQPLPPGLFANFSEFELKTCSRDTADRLTRTY